MAYEDEAAEFYCRSCDKPASLNRTLSRNYCMEALRTSYFLCGECRLFFISKKLVKQEVKEWYQENEALHKTPFIFFFNEAMEYLIKTVWDYHKKIGYKLARFKNNFH